MSERSQAPGTSEPRRTRRGLIALNAGLLAALGLIELAPGVFAQPNVTRPRGQYTLVGGEINSANSNAIYVLDSVNEEIVVVRFNESRKTVDALGYRDLRADVQALPGR